MGKFDDVAADFDRLMKDVDTSNAKALEQFYKELEPFFEQLGNSVRAGRDKIDEEFSVDPAVTEAMSNQASALGQIGQEQAALSATYRRRHEQDFERIENGRKNEAGWDWQSNQG